MFNLIKKDFLTIGRDRSELLILLIMPLILIAILSFSLRGFIEGEFDDIDQIPIALVVENDFDDDIEDFRQDLIDEGLPQEAVGQIIGGAREADPETIFLDIMTSPDLEELIDLKRDYNGERAQEAIYNEEVFAIITIPKYFSYNTLKAIFLEEDPQANLEALVPNDDHIYAGIISNILDSFADQYNLELSIAQGSQGQPIESQVTDDLGGTIHLERTKPVSSFQYYTVGMAVMFALYVASTISSNAFKEKKDHLFARLMLTGQSPLNYLLSKGISGTVITFVQLTILFVISTLAFQTFSGMSQESLKGMLVVTLAFSLTVGALASLLTAIALQFNSDAVSGVFSGVLVTVFAFLGGSMIQVEQFSPLLKDLGNWTPNGAMMTAYLQLVQGFELSHVLPMLYRVGAMTILFIIVALAIFPKRRLT